MIRFITADRVHSTAGSHASRVPSVLLVASGFGGRDYGVAQ